MKNLRRSVSSNTFLHDLEVMPPKSGESQITETPKNTGEPFKIAAESRSSFKASEGEKQSYSAAKGANEFAFKFSSLLLNSLNCLGNFLCSPFSVLLSLAALTNATDDSAKQKLLEVIGKEGITEQDLNTAASRMLYDITHVEENELRKECVMEPFDTLKIANALFLSNDKAANQKFAQIFADYYSGALISVDFASEEAIIALNDWACQHTDGLIPEIVKEFDPNALAAIANAIYFQDVWDLKFNEDDTREAIFYGKRSETKAQFMSKEEELLYFEDESFQAVNLNFSTGAALAIILPKDKDANRLLSSLNGAMFSEILDKMSVHMGKLLLPKFEIESDMMNLITALNALGLPLFDARNPAITGLFESKEPIYISQAVQKAVIKVDENGTTAAVITLLDAVAAGIPIETKPLKQFEMNCNSPFAFVLYENSSDGAQQVLFTGLVNEV